MTSRMAKKIRLRYSKAPAGGGLDAAQNPVGGNVQQDGGQGEIQDFHGCVAVLQSRYDPVSGCSLQDLPGSVIQPGMFARQILSIID